MQAGERGMNNRLVIAIAALAAGIAIGSFGPELSQRLRLAAGTSSATAPALAAAKTERDAKGPNDSAEIVKLSAEEIAAAGITVAAAQSGTIAHRLVVPGTIIPHADRIARVAVKLSATVAELRKKPGDPVTKDEVIAVLESREVADAKSEYLAARLNNELLADFYERDKVLWDKHITSEQLFLRSRNAALQAKMKLDIARQKLFALGLSDAELAGLPTLPEHLLRRQEVRAPIGGRIVERKVDLGMAVGRDNLETELFVIADLDPCWVELSVSPGDLALVKEGQAVTIAARGLAETAEGRIVFISPMLDKETRAARVVAEIANKDGIWRPGSFITATIAFAEQPVALVIPATAIQTMDAGPVAFVRTREGFAKRPLVLGRSDGDVVEVVSGLRAGETIAVRNTFPLKAELLKAPAED
jgi:cobalt-zinc-cadmium efflux system membrane fusion protein